MTIENKGRELIEELLSSPRRFSDDGKAYELLQLYFNGMPVETLRPLLTHPNEFVRKSASFLAAEIGEDATGLIDDVAVLVYDTDPHIQWNAMDSLIVCSRGEVSDRFVHIVGQLECENGAIRRLAMRLASRASDEQIAAGINTCARLGTSEKFHKLGLSTLLGSGSRENILANITSKEPVLRLYGVIGAARFRDILGGLLLDASENDDADIRQFANEALQ